MFDYCIRVVSNKTSLHFTAVWMRFFFQCRKTFAAFAGRGSTKHSGTESPWLHRPSVPRTRCFRPRGQRSVPGEPRAVAGEPLPQDGRGHRRFVARPGPGAGGRPLPGARLADRRRRRTSADRRGLAAAAAFSPDAGDIRRL